MSSTKLLNDLMRFIDARLDLLDRPFNPKHSVKNSIVYNIPRVKFSLSGSKYTISMFFAVEKWMRIEILKGDDMKTVISRSKSMSTPDDVITKESSLQPCDLAVSILANLFALGNIIIGSFDWEIAPDKDPNDTSGDLHEKRQIAVSKILIEKLKAFTKREKVFRVGKLTTVNTSSGIYQFLIPICNESDFESIEVILSESSTPPVAIMGYHSFGEKLQRPKTGSQYLSNFNTSILCCCRAAVKFNGIITMRFAKMDENAQKVWDSVTAKVETKSDFMRKIEYIKIGGILIIVKHYKNDCGYYYECINQNIALEIQKKGSKLAAYVNRDCGLGDLCQKCDPFNFWYHSRAWDQKISKDVKLQNPSKIEESTPEKLAKINPELFETYSKSSRLSTDCKHLSEMIDSLMSTPEGLIKLASLGISFTDIMKVKKISNGISGVLDTLLGAVDKALPEIAEKKGDVVELPDDYEDVKESEDVVEDSGDVVESEEVDKLQEILKTSDDIGKVSDVIKKLDNAAKSSEDVEKDSEISKKSDDVLKLTTKMEKPPVVAKTLKDVKKNSERAMKPEDVTLISDTVKKDSEGLQKSDDLLKSITDSDIKPDEVKKPENAPKEGDVRKLFNPLHKFAKAPIVSESTKSEKPDDVTKIFKDVKHTISETLQKPEGVIRESEVKEVKIQKTSPPKVEDVYKKIGLKMFGNSGDVRKRAVASGDEISAPSDDVIDYVGTSEDNGYYEYVERRKELFALEYEGNTGRWIILGVAFFLFSLVLYVIFYFSVMLL